MADGYTGAALNVFHNAGFAAVVTNPHISLHTANPGTTGANEQSGDGYARQPVTLTASSGGEKSNTADVVFGPASADWDVMYYGLWTAVTGGSFLGYWTIRDASGVVLSGPLKVFNTQDAVFSTGSLVFKLT